MLSNNKIDNKSSAVQVHLNILQSIIQRMAANSASCKTWCITLVSAILVIVANQGIARFALIAFIPTLVLLILDAYYLSLERVFRQSYDNFVEKLHKGVVKENDIYSISPKGPGMSDIFRSLISFSIWPFYVTLIIMILIAMEFII